MQPSQATLIRAGTLVLALACALGLQAGEPAKGKPPWQRLLQGDEGRQAAEQEKQLLTLQEAGKFAEALPPAEALAKRRGERQGLDHWQAVDARWTVDAIRRLLRQGQQTRDAYVSSFALTSQAIALHSKGHYREAQPLFDRVLAIRRRALGEDHPDTALSFAWVGANLNAQGQYAQAAEGYARALAIYRKVLGEDHPSTGASYNNVARNLSAQGQYAQAAAGYARTLAIYRTVLGEEHPYTATGYYNVAFNLHAQSQYAQAAADFARALAIRRKVLGEEHPDTATSYLSVAYSLNAQEEYAAAAADFARALAIRRKVLGEEHPDTATCYSNLASNLQAQGQYAAAAEGFARALAICRKVLGEEHLDTATCYNNVAANLNAQGQYAAAAAGYAQALAIRRKVLGEEHPTTAISYNNVAFNLNAQGQYTAAAAGYATALAIHRKILGEEHPATALSYNNVATNLNVQGKYAQAAAGLARALAIRRKVLGEEHLDTAQSYNNVAANLHAQGQYTQAAAGYARARAIHRKVLGEEHPLTALSYNNVAVNLNAQGQYAEAAAGYARALAIRRKVLGEEHPDTAQSYNNLAANLMAQGQYAEAAAGYAKALAIYHKVLGEEHPDTALTYHNLAVNLHAQGQYALAAADDAKALAIRRKVLGEDHPLTANSYNSLAGDLNAQGRYVEAAAGFAKALAIDRKVLGEEHPDTATSYNNVAFNLNAQGRYQEAEAHWLLAADRFARVRLRIAAGGLDRATKTAERSPLSALAAVLARNGKPEAAWQRFEEGLARGTWDDLSARLRRPAAEQARQAEFVARLNHLDQLLEKSLMVKEPTAALEQRRKDLLTQRRQVQNDFDAFARHLEKTYGPAAGQVFDRAQIQAALPADTALVGWLDVAGQPRAADRNGEHWAILLRATGTPVWVRLRGSGPGDAWTDADTRLPADLWAALHTSRGEWHLLARHLRQQRLAPLAQHLAASDGQTAVRHLLVLPSPALGAVPVDVFADNYTVSYALSGTLHAHLRQQPPPATQGLFALADAVFDPPPPAPRGGDTWPPLPGTRTEVEALRRLFGPESTPKLLVDSQASEQTLYDLAQRGVLGQYRYLHFATHGEVDDRFPLRSALILARDHLPDPGEQLDAGLPIYDGRLTAEKVLRQWHLHSELVTLSACQTALGKYEAGEGFVGFAQALLLAGSRSVVLSQWKVDDAATALLMDRFYQNLLGKRGGLKKPLPKAAALAEAKAWLRTLARDEAVKRTAQLRRGIERGKGRPALPPLPMMPVVPPEARDAPPYAHPYYWAAFVLIGDPN